MILIKRVVLDILKPRKPDCLDFSKSIAEQGENYKVTVNVIEVDDKTETIVAKIEGNDIQFDALKEAITNLGGSLHSIDEVEVVNVTEMSTTK